MAKFCSQCGTKNEEINNFCFLCGNSLANAATTNNTIKNKPTAATEAHAPMMEPTEPEHPTADISGASSLPTEAIKNEANIAKTRMDEPKPIEDNLARGIPHAKPNTFSAGSSTANKKSSSAIKNEYVYIASALVAATVMGGGIYWSQKPKVKEPIITMADITQPRVTKNSPMVSTIVSPEVKPANPASVIREESSPIAESKAIPPLVTIQAEATKQDLSPEIVKKPKVKVKKVIKTKAIKRVSKNTHNAAPNKHEPTEPVKAEAPVAHESKKETAIVNSTEEQKSEGLFDKLVKDVKKGAESECTLPQRALNQCN